MSGILNKKNRILDVVLTDIGRQQMNKGEFNVAFVSFSDKGVDYDHNEETNVISDISDRVYFESYSSPSDEIIPEISNVGDFLLTKKVSDTLEVNNGVLIETTASGYQEVDPFENMSSFTGILTGRYGGLQVLRSSKTLADFTISNEGSIELQSNSLQSLPEDSSFGIPILVDPRFSGSLNNLYLPPTTVNAEGNVVPLRAYNRFGPELNKSNVLNEILQKSRGSYRIDLGNNETYENYNILGQAFMKKDQSIKKYLVVDAGEFTNTEGKVDTHVYHLGFVYKDEYGTSKFSRALSLVFSSGDGLDDVLEAEGE